jgi:hypothetical protein
MYQLNFSISFMCNDCFFIEIIILDSYLYSHFHPEERKKVYYVKIHDTCSISLIIVF